MNKKEIERKEAIYEMRKKSPTVAVFLSIIIVGAGHFYAKKAGVGIILMVLCAISWLFLMGWIFWILAPILAHGEVKKYNELLRLELGI